MQGGESWLVHAIPVTSARGAGGYMGKYMAKEFDVQRSSLLGMQRRWSANAKWPRERRRRLVSGSSDGWRRTNWAAGVTDTAGWPGLTEFPKTGTEEQAKRDNNREAAKLLKMMKREL